MRNIYILTIICIFTASCDKSMKHVTHQWNNIDSVKSTQMFIDSSLLGCYDFDIINNHIIAHDLTKSSGKHYKCYQIVGDSLKFVNAFAGFGKGPYEALRATLRFLKQSNTAYYFESPSMITINNAYRIDANNVSNLFDVSTYNHLATPPDNTIYDICPVNTTGFIVSQVHDKNSMFAYYDMANLDITDLGMPYPEDEQKATNYVKSVVYGGGQTLKHPHLPKFIYSSQYGQYAFIFDLDNRQMQGVKILCDVLPSYTMTSDGYSFKSNEDCLGGIVSAVTAANVYLLAWNYKTATGNEVMVFDWNGNPIRKLILDKPVSYIEVDDDDRILYAFMRSTGADDEQIVQYKIKK